MAQGTRNAAPVASDFVAQGFAVAPICATYSKNTANTQQHATQTYRKHTINTTNHYKRTQTTINKTG